MNTKDVKKVIELLELAKIGEQGKEDEGQPKPEIEACQFSLPKNISKTFPLITVDGSYCFLFSFLGAETWIVLFRIAVTEYCIKIKNDKIHYCINAAPKIYDHLNLLSFNSTVLSSQPAVFSTVADIASRFQDRKAQIFASNIMTYLEDKTLEKISATRKNCILIKDGVMEKENKIELKKFCQRFLEFFRERINAEDPLFLEFKPKLGISTRNFDLNKKTFTRSEKILLEDMRRSLITTLGYPAFLLLQIGVMNINEISGEIRIDFIIPSFEKIVDALNIHKIKPLNNHDPTYKKYRDEFFDDLRNRPRTFLSLLLVGQKQAVDLEVGGFEYLYSTLDSEFLNTIYFEYDSSVKDHVYYSTVNKLFMNAFYNSYDGRSKFGERIKDARLKLLDILFDYIIDKQINIDTLKKYAPFSTMSTGEQTIWLELMREYYKIALADAAFYPQKGLDPTSILLDMIINIPQNLEVAITGYDVANKMAKNYQLKFGVLLSLLTQEEITQIAPALYYTYRHLAYKTNLENYRAMTTDHFWKLVERPIEHTVSQLRNILTSVDSDSFVVQFRRISHSGINNDKTGTLKSRVYNTGKADFDTHPEITSSNILITKDDLALGGDLDSNPLLKEKLYSIVYYMVKYQAFIVIKAEDARKTDVVLTATLTRIFTLDYVKSLTSDGNWGALTLTDDAINNYKTWQKDWNEDNVWNDGNAYIPFHLLLDYKSGSSSFLDKDGNLLGEGRLKELFFEKFGVDVEYLTRRLVA